MYPIERDVPNLKLCKRLKELGLPQDDGFFYWIKDMDNWHLAIRVSDDSMTNDSRKLLAFYCLKSCSEYNITYVYRDIDGDECVKASTVSELGRLLPDSIMDSMGKFCIEYDSNNTIMYLSCDVYQDSLHYVESDTEANARAEMLIWLLENRYLKVDSSDA